MIKVFFLAFLVLMSNNIFADNPNPPIRIYLENVETRLQWLKDNGPEMLKFKPQFICFEKFDDKIYRVNMIKRRPLLKNFYPKDYLTIVDPIFVVLKTYATPITSLGFYPGEKICFDWSVNDYEDTFEMTPNPLHFESEDGKLVLDAELTNIMQPTMYQLTLTGAQEGEEIEFTSKSGTEKMTHKFKFSSPVKIGYTPGVAGKKGGVAYLTFKSKSGQKITAEIPWGIEFATRLTTPEDEIKKSKY